MYEVTKRGRLDWLTQCGESPRLELSLGRSVPHVVPRRRERDSLHLPLSKGDAAFSAARVEEDTGPPLDLPLWRFARGRNPFSPDATFRSGMVGLRAKLTACKNVGTSSYQPQQSSGVPGDHQLFVGRDHPGRNFAARPRDSRTFARIGFGVELQTQPGRSFTDPPADFR